MNRKILLSLFLVLVSLFPAILWTLPVTQALADPRETEPIYAGIADYYDNRKCAVTVTMDDFHSNETYWEQGLSMLIQKQIYHTTAIITNYDITDWSYIQHWVDQGYTEAGSHSRDHVHAPYTGTDPYNGRNRVSYEWQINRSKNDIIGNLTLPDWWRYGDKEYVYAWIEPYGSCDNTVRQWLGDCHYLCDRLVSTGVYGFAGWDSSKGLFNRIGYTVEMGDTPWGGDTSVPSLNGKFDTAHNNGKIYHLITHPVAVDWSEGSYADQHTDYISNRKDVWYVSFGLLYLYHWVDVRNIVNVTSTGSGQNKIFKLSINETDHQNYGVSYPITYVFDIPSNWTEGYVYYRYLETDPWILMENKSPQDFFNGITAFRFDLTNHKAYVSVGFSNVSHEIYLQLRTRAITNITTSKTIIGQGYSLHINIRIVNYDVNTETFNVTAYADLNITIIEDEITIGVQNVTLTSGDSTTITFTWNTTGVPYGNYTISANATTVPGEPDTVDNTYTDGWVVVTILGDADGDGMVNIWDLSLLSDAWLSESGDPEYNPNADFNGDGDINVWDLEIMSDYWLQET